MFFNYQPSVLEKVFNSSETWTADQRHLQNIIREAISRHFRRRYMNSRRPRVGSRPQGWETPKINIQIIYCYNLYIWKQNLKCKFRTFFPFGISEHLWTPTAVTSSDCSPSLNIPDAESSLRFWFISSVSTLTSLGHKGKQGNRDLIPL